MKSKFYIPILLVVILISGCATTRMYEGEKLPKEQVATIKGGKVLLPLLLLWVGSGTSIPGCGSKLEVLPGLQKITVNVQKFAGIVAPPNGLTLSDGLAFVTLEFSAEAGHEYEIKAPFWWRKGSMITVVDMSSGYVVASRPIGIE